MAFARWDDSLSVGDLVLDNQHRQLFDLVNQLHDAMSRGQARQILDKILDRLVCYTADHFRDEERRMLQAGYPGLAAHKAEHDSLSQQVSAFQASFRSGAVALSVNLMIFLKDWLNRHILQADLKYAVFRASA